MTHTGLWKEVDYFALRKEEGYIILSLSKMSKGCPVDVGSSRGTESMERSFQEAVLSPNNKHPQFKDTMTCLHN